VLRIQRKLLTPLLWVPVCVIFWNHLGYLESKESKETAASIFQANAI